MDVNYNEKIVKRKPSRSNTVPYAKGPRKEDDYSEKGTNERRTKSASPVEECNVDYRVYFTRTLPLYKTRHRSDRRYRSYEVADLNTEEEICGIDGFAAEHFLHLENSVRMSQLRAEKKITFYAEELLHDSIQRDDVDELCALLSKHEGLNLEEANDFGITPLHRAAIDGGYRCLNFLLSRNVNVKVRDTYGWTPLHDAVYHGNVRCAAALITAGSDVEAETNDFIKPIEMAPDDEMLLLIGRAMTGLGYVYDQDTETLV